MGVYRMSITSQTHKRYLKDDDGNVYWPISAADAIIGLNEILPVLATPSKDGLLSAIDKQKIDGLTSYSNATKETDGLLSASDKKKLDSLKIEPVDAIRIKDSATGIVFKLTIFNGTISVIKDDANGQ